MEEKLNLLEFQRRFKKAVTQEKKPTLIRMKGLQLNETPEVSLETRLGVYRYAYWARIEESLADDYELVRKLVGKKEFTLLAKEYLKKYPTRYASLAEVSRHFSNFLKETEPWSKYEYLSEVARYEWEFLLAFLTEDPGESNLLEMQSLDFESLSNTIFILAPSLRFIKSKYPVHKLKCKKVEASEKVLKKTRLVIYRQQKKIKTLKIKRQQWKLLKQIAVGKTMQELWVKAESLSLPMETISLWFKEWVELGLIHRFEIKKQS